MIKAVVFDLNGVFIWSPKLSDRYEKEFGVVSGEFLPALKEVMGKARQPNAPDIFDLWKPYLEKWKLDLTRGQFLDFWFEAEGGNLEMVDLARSLKEKGLKVFILSNNFRERAEYYDKNFPFLREIFDRIYYSWQTGFVKPDERAFRLLLEENNLEAGEVIYFDDSPHNVEVARSLGIDAHVFEGPNQIISFIDVLGKK